ncbi:MAG TPA: SDR family oxidoreductase [Acidocella sp.]|uniref:SDR family oxidoreductase n=1 Tax=Acidocella sp. TaxID=50710 RepID=UPI002BF92C0F|nr:SDR family oxidoreductase [Acidocella sp.]HVE20746.1 SDR family oxidoreductase [Acidocella sp.]
MPDLLIFGCGYSGTAVARAARDAGFTVTVTAREPALKRPGQGIQVIPFDAAVSAIARATHLLATAAPGEAGDPVLARYEGAIRAAGNLRWIGYFSTTGVYGDQGGGWVDEDSPPAPGSERTSRRVQAEAAWRNFPVAVDIIRLAGIYGPGRSMFDDLRAGAARRVVKPGHVFGRIHREDIAHGVLVAMQRNAPPGVQIFNFCDDEPAASAYVVVEAARLLGVAPPDPVPYAEAVKTMSPMALSFWSENRKVASAKTKQRLGLTWRYPTYREGLRAILEAEAQRDAP